MRHVLILFLVATWAASALATTASYVDSRGRTRVLTVAPDRVLVAGEEAALRALRSREADFGTIRPLTPRRGLYEIETAAATRATALAALQKAPGIRRIGAVFATAEPGHHVRLDQHLFVKLREPAQASPAAVADATGSTECRALGHAGTTFLCRLRDAAAVLDANRRLADHPSVAWSLPDFLVEFEPHAAPDDPYYGEQWYLHSAPTGGIYAEEAWEVTTGAAAVVLAVVDTGLDEGHPDFGSERMVTGYDALDDDNDPWPGTKATHAHGTWVAGVAAAATNNGEGVAGICPECSLMGVRFMEGFSIPEQLSTAYLGLQYAADAGAWIINNSWGIYDANKPLVDMEPMFEAAREAALTGRDGLGAVVVFSAGNDGDAIGDDDLASISELLVVGGADLNDVVVEYSSFGSTVSVVAPTGVYDLREPQIYTTDTSNAHGANKGDGLYYTSATLPPDRPYGNLTQIDPSGDTTDYFQGTSASAPMVAGLAGLILSLDATLTANEVRSLIEQTADTIGVLPYDSAGRNDYYGHGRIHAGRAVRAAQYGAGQPGGAPCLIPVNCATGDCLGADGDTPGICDGPVPGDDVQSHADTAGADTTSAVDTASAPDTATDMASVTDTATDTHTTPGADAAAGSDSGSGGCHAGGPLAHLPLGLFLLVVAGLSRRRGQRSAVSLLGGSGGRGWAVGSWR